jgi:hypothetical protein
MNGRAGMSGLSAPQQEKNIPKEGEFDGHAA